MSEFDNLGDYADPIIYDSENHYATAAAAVQFCLRLCQRIGGPVLELGCGTGRYTIPIAKAGVEITGLDIMPGMLQRAEAKSTGLSVRWVLADARAFHLHQTFPFIFESGAMFQHLLTRADHEACLACVHEHLTDGGAFLLHATLPRLKSLQNTEYQDWFDHVDELGRHIYVSGEDRYDPLQQVKYENAVRRWRNEAGDEVIAHAPLALRQFFPQEFEALLHYNGFVVNERYGDWDGNPLLGDSPYQIYLCGKR